jgi:type III secretory pathway component EscU
MFSYFLSEQVNLSDLTCLQLLQSLLEYLKRPFIQALSNLSHEQHVHFLSCLLSLLHSLINFLLCLLLFLFLSHLLSTTLDLIKKLRNFLPFFSYWLCGWLVNVGSRHQFLGLWLIWFKLLFARLHVHWATVR